MNHTDLKFHYTRQPSKPEWFGKNPHWRYFYTKSNSLGNSWYGFPDRESAVKFLLNTLPACHNGLDDYVAMKGDLYHLDQFTEDSVNAAEDANDYVLRDSAEPIDLLDLVEICSDDSVFQFTLHS